MTIITFPFHSPDNSWVHLNLMKAAMWYGSDCVRLDPAHPLLLSSYDLSCSILHYSAKQAAKFACLLFGSDKICRKRSNLLRGAYLLFQARGPVPCSHSDLRRDHDLFVNHRFANTSLLIFTLLYFTFACRWGSNQRSTSQSDTLSHWATRPPISHHTRNFNLCSGLSILHTSRLCFYLKVNLK